MFFGDAAKRGIVGELVVVLDGEEGLFVAVRNVIKSRVPVALGEAKVDHVDSRGRATRTGTSAARSAAAATVVSCRRCGGPAYYPRN